MTYKGFILILQILWCMEVCAQSQNNGRIFENTSVKSSSPKVEVKNGPSSQVGSEGLKEAQQQAGNSPIGSAELALWLPAPPDSPEAPTQTSSPVQVNHRSETKMDRALSNIHAPTLSFHLPPAQNSTGTMVIICPGDEFSYLAIDKEGHDVARWLNSMGIAAAVLKYRIPRALNYSYGPDKPLEDVRRSIRAIRSAAGDFNVSPNRIGLMGFSTGGLLAALATATYQEGDREKAETQDLIDRISCKPDFLILAYPVTSLEDRYVPLSIKRNFLGDRFTYKDVRRYSPVYHVNPDMPPAFIMHATDDPLTSENSVIFYLALKQAGVRADLHIYSEGGHGFGVSKTGLYAASWKDRCADWLQALGATKPIAATTAAQPQTSSLTQRSRARAAKMRQRMLERNQRATPRE